MPILHRLATFRDDIIFFIWLYQKWAYKVDYSRVNEFGQGGEEEDATKEKENEKTVQGQNTASMKPAAAVATSSGAEKKEELVVEVGRRGGKERGEEWSGFSVSLHRCVGRFEFDAIFVRNKMSCTV